MDIGKTIRVMADPMWIAGGGAPLGRVHGSPAVALLQLALARRCGVRTFGTDTWMRKSSVAYLACWEVGGMAQNLTSCPELLAGGAHNVREHYQESPYR